MRSIGGPWLLPPPPFLASFWPPARDDDDDFFRRHLSIMRRRVQNKAPQWPLAGISEPDVRWPLTLADGNPSTAFSSPPQRAEVVTANTTSRSHPILSAGTILSAIAGIGFAGSVAGAFIYTMRKGRKEALREAQEAAAILATGSTVATENGIRGAAQGLRQQSGGRKAVSSIFDSDASALPPSVLRRSPSYLSAAVSESGPAASLPSSSASTTSRTSYPSALHRSRGHGVSVGHTSSHYPCPSNATEAQELAASGPLLALKAFGIATALVGIVSLVTVEILRRLWDVRDIDDFVIKVTRAIRSVSPARNDSNVNADDGEGEEAATAALPLAPPLLKDSIFMQLSEARTPEEWFRLLKSHLDAESTQDALARAQRVRLRDQAESAVRKA
ncbi:hypothetical protein K437DRAFT_271450 [Tilletiaria anomala UBC 951]|uniref:Transmembrane protein n=1 Tax=Tilletiaria anomala (strain ATCC 24038 / CBS 436.72 / UBC 951) TaxID=1037660 RepID=A0A066WS56_TILAU|nr:uncharacterized protein K437DRAFT_271450 [Tilletiaria anomala UBC 951]KDN53520.1 hypothetical protein K437DRAFT_271450 [Tilletiaria anomala UBC 951]